MKPDEREHPEREHVEEAFLLQAWSDGLPASDFDEIPEDVLGLLDGSLTGPEADAAREKLSRDPQLAKAARTLLAEMRDAVADPPTPREPPGRLLSDAIELGRDARAPEARTLAQRLGDLFRGSPWPGLAAGLAGVFVVAVLLRGPFTGASTDTLRGAETQEVVELVAPIEGSRLEGDVELRWSSVPDAVRYRVVLAELSTGTLRELPPTRETRVLIPRATLQALAPKEREIHWTVHVRRRDGSETSSAPGRFVWLPSD